MNNLKQRLTTDWHFMRLLRLGFGLAFAVEAIVSHDVMMGLVGIFFLYQSVFNAGCCGTVGCVAPPQRRNVQQTKDIEFEEVK